MAVLTSKDSTKLSIVMITGVDEKGDDVKKTMSLSKIKVTASDDNLFAVAKAIEPLLKYPVASIEKNDVYTLANA
ncbi:DUF1659 domain-containing protein [Clostridium thermarum]|uniref:DUF1659 domain-containing protein n=1 Tax=Clostridium thermarum TaxID=1716543 RepID=UPI0013D714D3|nr:DUF1659 domain-containing protein [Clostridium thermarum]